MKCLFVVNARSGPRRKVDVSRAIRDHCEREKIEFDLRPCERKEDLDDVIAHAAREKYDVLFAVGGDGTVHEVAKRLIGQPVALGIVPTGSGNGFARHVGLPLALQASLATCSSGRITTIDTASVNGMPFLGVMGAGFDALIAHRFAESPERGMRTYVKKGLYAFAEYKPALYEIEIDGEHIERRAFVVAIANSSQYGNNARIAPLASLQDGLLDLVTVEDVSIYSALPLLVRLFNGTIHRSHRAKVAHGKHIVIRREEDGPAHLDGEPVMLPALLDVRVVPASLRVLVPSSVSRL
jgi:YegS/Rv2252/BmrU family lipid kinase